MMKVFTWVVVLAVAVSVAVWLKGPAVPAVSAPAAVAPPASTSWSPTRASSPYSAAASAPAPVALPGETVTVTRVVDGDTFFVGDRKIRVLGVDACEASTSGGRDATERARELLLSPGNQVSLTREPGVDLDPFDRELRYVHYAFGNSPYLGVQDFGEFMVGFYHTGVYEGRNDASDEYVSRLRAADEYTGRDCSSAPGPTASDVDVDVDVGDDDNRESRFCRGRVWC